MIVLWIFSVIMIPISTIVPIAMMMPASDMICASTWKSFIMAKENNTDIGSESEMIILILNGSKNARMTAIVIMISIMSASVRVPCVSRMRPVLS